MHTFASYPFFSFLCVVCMATFSRFPIIFSYLVNCLWTEIWTVCSLTNLDQSIRRAATLLFTSSCGFSLCPWFWSTTINFSPLRGQTNHLMVHFAFARFTFHFASSPFFLFALDFLLRIRTASSTSVREQHKKSFIVGRYDRHPSRLQQCLFMSGQASVFLSIIP